MLVFIIRRLIVSFFVLLAATAIVYLLTANAGDPLADLREDQSPNRDQKIAQRIEIMQLEVPPPLRYLYWLRGVSGCVLPFVDCDLGQNRFGQDVSAILALAMSSTLRLVLTAALVAIVIGIAVGIVSALRQYSGFDYSITFAAFVFFSLPSFWVAVLLKQYGAITFNDWLRDPVIPLPVILVVAVLSGVIWMAVLGGSLQRRLITFALGRGRPRRPCSSTCRRRAGSRRPRSASSLIAVSAIGIAFLVTALVSGLAKRNVLYAALASAGVGIISFFATQPVLINPTWWHLVMLGAITVAVGIGIGYLLGGLDKPQAMRAAVLTGLLTGGLIFWDHVLLAVPGLQRTGQRPRGVDHRVQHPELHRRLLAGLPRQPDPPAAADDRADPDLVRHLHPVHPGEHARGDEPGLRAHRPVQGPHRAHRDHAARLPQRPDPRHHADGVRLRRHRRRRDHHREGVRLEGDGHDVQRRASAWSTRTR